MAVLSFASLSMVTSQTKEVVRKILTDLFACLIETSRKTNKEARLKMKGFGTLYLFKNRELAFQEIDMSVDLGNLEKSNNMNLFLERQKEREDLSFIDQASAILSRGGGQSDSQDLS